MSIGVGFKPDIPERENIVISRMLLEFSLDEVLSVGDHMLGFMLVKLFFHYATELITIYLLILIELYLKQTFGISIE